MGKAKTYEDYEHEIREAWEAGEGLHFDNAVQKWAERVPLSFYVANNEQKPYTAEELGCPVYEMPLKKKNGFNQTADYHCFVVPYGKQTGVFWERKELSDLYNTLIHNHDRFMDECSRAYADPRCDYLIIGAEGTQDRFLTYKPCGSKGAALQARYGACMALSPRYEYRVILKWYGNRATAIKNLIKENRMWVKYHYPQVLGLKPIQ